MMINHLLAIVSGHLALLTLWAECVETLDAKSRVVGDENRRGGEARAHDVPVASAARQCLPLAQTPGLR